MCITLYYRLSAKCTGILCAIPGQLLVRSTTRLIHEQFSVRLTTRPIATTNQWLILPLSNTRLLCAKLGYNMYGIIPMNT